MCVIFMHETFFALHKEHQMKRTTQKPQERNKTFTEKTFSCNICHGDGDVFTDEKSTP